MIHERYKPIFGWMLQLLGVVFLILGLMFSITLIGGCVAMPLVFIAFPTLALGRQWVDEGRRTREHGAP